MYWLIGLFVFSTVCLARPSAGPLNPEGHLEPDTQRTVRPEGRRVDNSGKIPGVYGFEQFNTPCDGPPEEQITSEIYRLALVERGGKYLRPARSNSDTAECALLMDGGMGGVKEVLTAKIGKQPSQPHVVLGFDLGKKLRDGKPDNRDYSVYKRPGDENRKKPPLFAITICKRDEAPKAEGKPPEEFATRSVGRGRKSAEPIVTAERDQENGKRVDPVVSQEEIAEEVIANPDVPLDKI